MIVNQTIPELFDPAIVEPFFPPAEAQPEQEPDRICFVCRICGREDSFENASDWKRGLGIAKEMGFQLALPTVCHRCREEMDTQKSRMVDGEIRKYAPPCLEEMIRRYKATPFKKRPPLRVPEEYADTSPRHPDLDQRAYWAVQAHAKTSKNLLLRGKSGLGKSRSAWMLLVELWGAGQDVIAFDTGTLVDTAAEKRRKGWGQFWTKSLIEVPVLFLDDLGNEQGGEALIFHLIKSRLERRTGRTIVTTQHTGGTLYQESKNPARVAALHRRLSDSFVDIQFIRAAKEFEGAKK